MGKICKGTTKAKGYGCGEDRYIVRYGLCQRCWRDWLLNTKEGQELIKKRSLKASKNVKKERRQNARALKQKLETKADAEKKIQQKINKIIRLMDVDKGCISCEHGWDGNFTRQAHAGHRWSRGANPQLRFNFWNIFKQCSICNNWKSGNETAFDKGIEKIYGIAILDRVHSLKSLEVEKWTKDQLRATHGVLNKLIKDLENGKEYTRDECNELFAEVLYGSVGNDK